MMCGLHQHDVVTKILRDHGGSGVWKAVAIALLVLATLLAVLPRQQGGRRLQLQSLQPEKVDYAFTRGLVFDSVWGRHALGQLRSYRSSLFERMAEQYTLLEKEKTEGGRLANIVTWRPPLITRLEPPLLGRFNVANPITSCPYGPLQRVGGDGDGGKFLCSDGLLSLPGCIILSLGSNGQFEFEEEMLKSTTCKVHTLDCTYDGKSLDGSQRHFYHKACIGRRTTTKDGLQFWDYHTTLRNVGHGIVALLKIDVEGFEFDVLSAWREETCELPLQVAMEVHYRPLYGRKASKLDFTGLFWTGHIVSLGEIAAFFGHLANLGYAVVSREDNAMAPRCCAEFTLLRVEQPSTCHTFS